MRKPNKRGPILRRCRSTRAHWSSASLRSLPSWNAVSAGQQQPARENFLKRRKKCPRRPRASANSPLRSNGATQRRFRKRWPTPTWRALKVPTIKHRSPCGKDWRNELSAGWLGCARWRRLEGGTMFIRLRAEQLWTCCDSRSASVRIDNDRGAPALLNQHGFGLRAQGYSHGIGKQGSPAQDLFACGRVKQDLFVRHLASPEEE